MDPGKYDSWARKLWVRRQKEIKEAKKHAKRRGPQPKPEARGPRGLLGEGEYGDACHEKALDRDNESRRQDDAHRRRISLSAIV